MGTRMKVESNFINFELNEKEITGYKLVLETKNAKYAKSNDTYQTLKITGDVQRIVTNNELIYKMIKDWTKIRYGMSADFYVKVTVTQIVMDEVFREIVFPNAYMQDFMETLNPNTGEGFFEITLLQKIDKIDDIVINPFDGEFKEKEVEESTEDYVFTSYYREPDTEPTAFGPENAPYQQYSKDKTNETEKNKEISEILKQEASQNKNTNSKTPLILKYIVVKKGYKVKYNEEKNCIELYKGDKLEKEISKYYVHNGTAIVSTELFRLKFNNNWSERYHEIFDLYDSAEDVALAVGCIYYKLGLNFKFGVKEKNNKYMIDLTSSESSILFKMNNNKICEPNGKILYDMDKIFDAATTQDVRVEDPRNDYITIDNWLKLYESPTVSGNGRIVKPHPDANKYDWGMKENQSDINSYAKNFLESKGISVVVKIGEKGELTDGEERYWIAVGPNVMNVEHKIYEDITIDEMKYGTKIDIIVLDEKTNVKYYIPSIVGDVKAHTWPDGLYQTGRSFPNGELSAGNEDGSTIEFMGKTRNGTDNFKLIGLIVYDN